MYGKYGKVSDIEWSMVQIDTTTKCGNGYKNSVYKILSIKVKAIKSALFAGVNDDASYLILLKT